MTYHAIFIEEDKSQRGRFFEMLDEAEAWLDDQCLGYGSWEAVDDWTYHEPHEDEGAYVHLDCAGIRENLITGESHEVHLLIREPTDNA